MKQLAVLDMRPQVLHAAYRQSGVGMVEILVAVLILSIGVLGFAGMQLKALKSTGNTFGRSQATVLAGDIVSRIAVNPGQLAAYSTGWPITADTSAGKPSWWETCHTATCSGAALAAWDVKQTAWLAGHLLPNGTARVGKCVGASTYCVVVAWNKTSVLGCEAGTATADDGSNKDCVVMQVVP